MGWCEIVPPTGTYDASVPVVPEKAQGTRQKAQGKNGSCRTICGVNPFAFCLLPFAFCLLPYFEAGRSIDTVSSVNFFSSVPVGTRNENVHENDGVAPTSAKDCAVL